MQTFGAHRLGTRCDDEPLHEFKGRPVWKPTASLGTGLTSAKEQMLKYLANRKNFNDSFNGDPLDLRRFLIQFNRFGEYLPPAIRLDRLYRSCHGEARAALVGIIDSEGLTPEVIWEKAVSKLMHRFGRPERVADAWKRELIKEQVKHR